MENHIEETLTGLKNLGRQGETDICIKCHNSYIIAGWNFYNLCEGCFKEWRTIPRELPPNTCGTPCMDLSEFLKMKRTLEYVL